MDSHQQIYGHKGLFGEFNTNPYICGTGKVLSSFLEYEVDLTPRKVKQMSIEQNIIAV